MNKKPYIIIGSGGHATVLANILLLQNKNILGCISLDKETSILNIPVIGDDGFLLSNFKSDEILLVNGIGSTHQPTLRRKIFQTYKEHDYQFATVIHPSVILPLHYQLAEGVQLMAGATIQPNVQIGENSIVNTRASIDHDCIIGAHVHIAPGVTLSGNVNIKDYCHIGTGTTIIQNITIGQYSLIGAGSLVIQDIPTHTKALGVPAKEVSTI